MKRTLVGFVLVGLYATASAQGYAGALIGMSNYSLDCKGLSPCDKKDTGAKIFAGTQFKQGLLNTERFKIDTLEVSFARFGSTKANTGTTSYTSLGGNGQPVTTTQPTQAKAKASALTLAGVGRALITPRLTASAKLGVALVQSTVDRSVGSVTNDSETTSKFRPYVGVGIEFAVLDTVKLIGNFDHTKFDSDGYKGNLQMIGIGAQIGF